MRLLPRRLIFIGLIALGFAAIIATPAISGTTSSGQAVTPLKEQVPSWDQVSDVIMAPVGTVSGKHLSTLPPPAEQNPCLHCHIAGEIYNEWSPISRWFVFGAMGLTFVFGVSRNFIVWRTRERWHRPLDVSPGQNHSLIFHPPGQFGNHFVFHPNDNLRNHPSDCINHSSHPLGE